MQQYVVLWWGYVGAQEPNYIIIEDWVVCLSINLLTWYRKVSCGTKLFGGRVEWWLDVDCINERWRKGIWAYCLIHRYGLIKQKHVLIAEVIDSIGGASGVEVRIEQLELDSRVSAVGMYQMIESSD